LHGGVREKARDGGLDAGPDGWSNEARHGRAACVMLRSKGNVQR
jgi:hypothetical protein